MGNGKLIEHVYSLPSHTLHMMKKNIFFIIFIFALLLLHADASPNKSKIYLFKDVLLDPETLQTFLQEPQNFTTRLSITQDQSGLARMPIHLATEACDIELIRNMISSSQGRNHFDLRECVDSRGWRPIEYAVITCPEVLTELIPMREHLKPLSDIKAFITHSIKYLNKKNWEAVGIFLGNYIRAAFFMDERLRTDMVRTVILRFFKRPDCQLEYMEDFMNMFFEMKGVNTVANMKVLMFISITLTKRPLQMTSKTSPIPKFVSENIDYMIETYLENAIRNNHMRIIQLILCAFAKKEIESSLKSTELLARLVYGLYSKRKEFDSVNFKVIIGIFLKYQTGIVAKAKANNLPSRIVRLLNFEFPELKELLNDSIYSAIFLNDKIRFDDETILNEAIFVSSEDEPITYRHLLACHAPQTLNLGSVQDEEGLVGLLRFVLSIHCSPSAIEKKYAVHVLMEEMVKRNFNVFNLFSDLSRVTDENDIFLLDRIIFLIDAETLMDELIEKALEQPQYNINLLLCIFKMHPNVQISAHQFNIHFHKFLTINAGDEVRRQREFEFFFLALHRGFRSSESEFDSERIVQEEIVRKMISSGGENNQFYFPILLKLWAKSDEFGVDMNEEIILTAEEQGNHQLVKALGITECVSLSVFQYICLFGQDSMIVSLLPQLVCHEKIHLTNFDQRVLNNYLERARERSAK